jgi:hypothetical protein
MSSPPVRWRAWRPCESGGSFSGIAGNAISTFACHSRSCARNLGSNSCLRTGNAQADAGTRLTGPHQRGTVARLARFASPEYRVHALEAEALGGGEQVAVIRVDTLEAFCPRGHQMDSVERSNEDRLVESSEGRLDISKQGSSRIRALRTQTPVFQCSSRMEISFMSDIVTLRRRTFKTVARQSVSIVSARPVRRLRSRLASSWLRRKGPMTPVRRPTLSDNS